MRSATQNWLNPIEKRLKKASERLSGRRTGPLRLAAWEGPLILALAFFKVDFSACVNWFPWIIEIGLTLPIGER